MAIWNHKLTNTRRCVQPSALLGKKCFSLRTVCKACLVHYVRSRNTQANFAFKCKSRTERLVNGSCQSGSLVKYQKEVWESYYYLKVLTELDLHASRNWFWLEQCEIWMDWGRVSETCLLSQREIEPEQWHVWRAHEQNGLDSRCPRLADTAFVTGAASLTFLQHITIHATNEQIHTEPLPYDNS